MPLSLLGFSVFTSEAGALLLLAAQARVSAFRRRLRGRKETAVAVSAVGEGGRAGDGAARCLPSHEALLPWKASI